MINTEEMPPDWVLLEVDRRIGGGNPIEILRHDYAMGGYVSVAADALWELHKSGLLPEPADRHLVKARELVAMDFDRLGSPRKNILNGKCDEWKQIQAIAQALREAAGGAA